jgi:hypothetical protein
MLQVTFSKTEHHPTFHYWFGITWMLHSFAGRWARGCHLLWPARLPDLTLSTLMESGTLIKLVRLIKMCLNKTYNKKSVWANICTIRCIQNDLKQGNITSPVLFNFTPEHTIRRSKKNKRALELNGTYLLLVYVHKANLLGKHVHIIKKNTEAVLDASWDIHLTVNAHSNNWK